MTSIVYIEDDPMSRQIMTLLLKRKMGISEVLVLENSDGFLEKINALPAVPDIIFLDIHMQPLSGFEVLKILRAMPSFQHTKIVALTASVMSEEVNLLRQAGFDGVIGKPLSQTVFPELFDRILNGEKIWRPT